MSSIQSKLTRHAIKNYKITEIKRKKKATSKPDITKE